MRWNRAVILGFAGALLCCAGAQAAAPELSTSNRLQDRREIAAGQRSYAEGFADGRFYANGWHITGEMGGVWTPPLKLLDGVWFGIGNTWVGQATQFNSGWGYTRYVLPDTGGLQLTRTDFAPDDHRAVLFGLRMTNPGATRTVTVKVDAHSELMGAYPWGFSGVVPNASDNLPDHGRFDGRTLVFTDNGSIGSGAPMHHYAALVASNQTPASGTAAAEGGEFRGPQAGHSCAANDGTSPPSACDDGPFGKGTGGELRYRLTIPAGGSKTLWIAAAGSDHGLGAARSELAGALNDPAGELAQKIASRRALARNTEVSLPGDPLLARAVEWGKQNLADLTQTASNLQIRWTNQGKQFPGPLGTVARARWFGAGFPDYPWIFATDGEYTAFAAVALGQFQTIEDHLRALRDISDILNNRSGIVVHETVSDGSVWFGHDSQTTNSDGSKTNDFNTDETVKFPSAVALVWRWTGDNRFRDEMYDFVKRNMQVVDQRLDVDRDGWPEGSGNVERPGMGPEKLDNGVYYMRGLYDLADMARSKGDTVTATWATNLADKLRQQFEATWWDPSVQQYADSLIDPGNQQSFQKHWIGVVPMEAELTFGDQVTPGVAAPDHAATALTQREDVVLQRRPARATWDCSTPGAVAARTVRATARSSRSRRRSKPSVKGTTDAWGRNNSSATPMPTPRRCSPSRPPAALRTSSRARCRRSSPQRLRIRLCRASRPTSTAAGRAARCSCRPGATTAPRGRSSTSGSGYARSWATGRCKSYRRCPTASRAWPARTSGWATGRSTCSPPTPEIATRPDCWFTGCGCSRSRSGRRSRLGPRPRAWSSMDSRPATRLCGKQTEE